MTITPDGVRSEVRSTDFIKADRLLSDAEMEVRERVRGFVDRTVIPSAAEHWDRAEFPFDVLPGLGELGIMGGTFSPEYGCAGWNNVAYGLAIAELARGSGSLATFLHVQSGLAMTAIHELGSEGQKRRRRPRPPAAPGAGWRAPRSPSWAARSRNGAGSHGWRSARRSAASASPSPTPGVT